METGKGLWKYYRAFIQSYASLIIHCDGSCWKLNSWADLTLSDPQYDTSPYLNSFSVWLLLLSASYLASCGGSCQGHEPRA
jgi:hypothetical protein